MDPPPVLATMRDTKDYIRVFLYLYYTAIAGSGVVLDFFFWGGGRAIGVVLGFRIWGSFFGCRVVGLGIGVG